MKRLPSFISPLATVLWFAALAALTAGIYYCYGALVHYITAPGAGWRGFLLAFSSVIPSQAVLWIYNWTITKGLPLRKVISIVLDIAVLAILLLNIDYYNLTYLEY